MASDEDEELAVLRASRREKLGSAGLTRTEQRRRIDELVRVAQPNTDDNDDDIDNENGNDDEEEVDEATLQVESVDHDLRHQFPMSFGVLPVEQGTAAIDAIASTARQQQNNKKKTNLASQPTNGNIAGGISHVPALLGGAAVDEDQLVGPMPPVARGPADDDEDEELVGPRPPGTTGPAGDDGDEELVGPRPPQEHDDHDKDDEDEEQDPYLLPVSHEVKLQGFTRVVSAVDVDRAGGRVAAGGHDYKVCLYDFGGMRSDAKPFREVEPSEGHPVHAVSWSPSGDSLLVVTGSAQPKVYSRDGVELGEFVRGDMYIRDMKNTKGHVSGCTGGQWHPTDRYSAMTCSEDGTVRVWDTQDIVQKTVVKPTPTRPGRVQVTAACYSGDGELIAAGLMDGTLQVWDVRGNFARSAAVGHVLPPKAQMHLQNTWKYISGTRQIVKHAHEADSEISGLAIAPDNFTMVSRCTDATVKLWDLRKFKTPLHTFVDLPNNVTSCNVVFSPDGQLIITGTSAGRDGNGGAVVFLDKSKLELVRRVGMDSTVAVVKWHPKINQVFAGTGDRKHGAPCILYSPALSEKGALMSVTRGPRAKNPYDFQAPLVIHTPHALPLFRDNQIRKRKRGEEEQVKAASSRAPDPGKVAQGPGRGGKIGVTGGTLLTQHLLKQHGLLHDPKQEDVRAAILRHGEKGTDELFKPFTAAYAKTQPVPIFAEPDPEEEDEEAK